MKAIFRVFAVALLAGRLGAADLPAAGIPQSVGVNIHFTTGRNADLDRIAAAGIRVVRMDFVWEATEREKGKYDFSAYDALTAGLEKRGIRALYILDYSNPLYEPGGLSPQHAESIAAFARWAAAAAKHFQGRRILWEIWNEPNISFWKGDDRPRQYTALALATARAIREADPKATILAPASSGFPWEFFETLFASGILEDIDAVSVHPYRGDPPETVSADYARLRELIARHTGKSIPIVCGEWGYSSASGGVSLETQADYAVRQQLWNLAEGVPFSIWYDWMNDGAEAAENEHNFGLVAQDLTPKPAYLAIREMTRELGGFRFVERRRTERDDDVILVFESADGARKAAAWTRGEPHAVNVEGIGELPLTPAPIFRAVGGR